jgi:DNA-binding transcriptional ArsR family regulator
MDMTETFKALSNPTRLRILMWLKDPEANFPEQGGHPGVPDDLKGGVCVGSIRDKAGISVFSQACLSALSMDFFRVRARNFFVFRHGRAADPTSPTCPA